MRERGGWAVAKRWRERGDVRGGKNKIMSMS
jgi:hypothetical protein